MLLQPMLGAIATGYCAVLKTSEYAPNRANLLAELMPNHLYLFAYCVVNGAVEEATKVKY
jgi:aldehyde dehydrogenase (NAD+)